MSRQECEHGYFLGKGCDSCAEYERAKNAESGLIVEVIQLETHIRALESFIHWLVDDYGYEGEPY